MSRSIDRVRNRAAIRRVEEVYGADIEDILGALIPVDPNVAFDWEIVNPDRVVATYANGQHSWDAPGDVKLKNCRAHVNNFGGVRGFAAYQLDRGGVISMDVDYRNQGTPQTVAVHGGEATMTGRHDYGPAKAAPVRARRTSSRSRPSPTASGGGIVSAIKRFFR